MLGQLGGESANLVSPEQWCQASDEFDRRVVTDVARSNLAVTTSGWSFVRDHDGSDHLFLKPDDVDDTNDVGRLRSDVVDRLLERLG